MQLTAWEYDSLIEHIKSRSDVWEPGNAVWYRLDTEGGCACALMTQLPKANGPFRLYNVQLLPQSWDANLTEAYLRKLVYGWTDYGLRMQFLQFLQDELHIDPPRASAAAVILAGIASAETPRTAIPPIAEQLDLFPELPTRPERTYTDIKTYVLRDGGYVRLQFVNERIRATLSLPNDPRYGRGFASMPLEGTLRSRDGRNALAAAFLGGWPLVYETKQLPLPEEA